ncbi:nucleotidyl transferase AbiEii/AbiGii toxin family protein [archaeon]|nr:nucleotidyl transferase AbiEii/AbiGii toxin family protein [archaeon]
MITKRELQTIAKNIGLNLGQTEKNYLHIITLHAISKLAPEKLVFKGGTALMICHSLNRFSEDLDFTVKEKTNIEKILDKIKKFLEEQEIEAEITQTKSTLVSKKYTIRYKGPLYDGSRQTTSKVELDFSLREKIQQKTNMTRIIHKYPDTPTFYIQTMNLEEMFAEKIRTIVTRNKARDLFDTEFLIINNIKPNKKIINKKLEYYNKKFSLKELKEKIEDKRKIWKPELKNLVEHIPDFDKVKKKILKEF